MIPSGNRRKGRSAVHRRRIELLAVALCGLTVLCLGQGSGSALLGVSSCLPPSPEETAAALEGLSFDEFVDVAYQHLLLHHPETITFQRLADELGVRNDRWTDYSPEGIAAREEFRSLILDRLDAFSDEDLTEQQRLTAAVLRYRVEGSEEVTLALWPCFFGYDDSAHMHPLLLLRENHPLESAEDVEDYLARMRGIADWIDQFIAIEDRRSDSACPTSWYVLNEAQASIREAIPWGDERHILVAHLEESFDDVAGLDEAGRESAIDRAESIAREFIVPSYERLRNKMSEWMAVAPKAFGLECCPDMADAYRRIVAEVTDLTAEQVHELAKAEAFAMREELDRLVETTNLSDPGFGPHATPQASCPLVPAEDALAEYMRLVEESETQCESLFLRLPQASVSVELFPWTATSTWLALYRYSPYGSDLAPTFAVGYSESTGVAQVSRPLVYHEVHPGHHLQLALAGELDLPLVRATYRDGYFVEGWATYAETLAWELGWYEDDYCGGRDYLLLRMEHAALAALDTGLHVMGWSRDEALGFLQDIYGFWNYTPPLFLVTACPAEYLEYWLGQSVFLDLRSTAQDALGDSFDLRKFHDVVLRNGVLPIPVLEEEVDRYIEEALTN